MIELKNISFETETERAMSIITLILIVLRIY